MPMPKGLNPRQQELWRNRQKFLEHVRDTLMKIWEKQQDPYDSLIDMDTFLTEISDICVCTYEKAEDYFYHFLKLYGCFELKPSQHAFKVIYEAIQDNDYDVEFLKPKVAKIN